jgi:hypothetical protein
MSTRAKSKNKNVSKPTSERSTRGKGEDGVKSALEDTTYDEQAYNVAKGWLAAVRGEEIIPPRFDIVEGARVALRLSNGLAAYRQAIPALDEAQPGVAEAIERLPTLARAMRYTINRRDETKAGESNAAVPEALVTEAMTLRRRMTDVLAYHVDAPALQDSLAYIRKGQGHRDLGNDVESLAIHYNTYRKILQADTTKYRASDAARAAQLANEIHGHLDQGNAKASERWNKEYLRAATLLDRTFRRAQRAMRFLSETDEPSDSLQSAAYIASGASKRGPAPALNEDETPGPDATRAAPADAPTAVAPAQPASSASATSTDDVDDDAPAGAVKPKTS